MRYLHISEASMRSKKLLFVGDLPIMTDRGTFIYNGAERVVVTQLVRSPAPYYEQAVDKSNTKFHGATIIPNRGAWLEYSTEAGDYIAIRIDRARKQPITTFLRALGLGTDEMIYSVFGADPQLAKTVEKDMFANIFIKISIRSSLETIVNTSKRYLIHIHLQYLILSKSLLNLHRNQHFFNFSSICLFICLIT